MKEKHPKIRERIEHNEFSGFAKKRLLITAEHALTKTIRVDDGRIFIGDRNTGILARITAFGTSSAYAIPRFNRYYADASRNPSLLGKGVPYRAKVKVLKGGKIRWETKIINTHISVKYAGSLAEYHRTIEALNPRAILSIHGKSSPSAKKKFHMLLGAGPDYEYMGGKRNAFRFRRRFREKIKEVLSKMQLDERGPLLGEDINSGLSRRLSGRRNFILKKFVAQHNESGRKRIGLQVELDDTGRKLGPNKNVAYEYQIALQVIADMLAQPGAAGE